ncbi:hypothetical protein M8J76_012556 [Diaphorina citri]|nr:hypothetical protein M8J76_012556 [Diaphorina citri]
MTEEEIAQYSDNLSTESTWPADLQYFTDQCRKSRLNTSKYAGAPPIKLTKALQQGIGAKKMHEVSILSSLINEKCKEENINSLVDIGSGVGYLDEILVHSFDFNVLGLECDQAKIDGALTRITKHAKSNVEYRDKLKYICTFIANTGVRESKIPDDPSAIEEDEIVKGVGNKKEKTAKFDPSVRHNAGEIVKGGGNKKEKTPKFIGVGEEETPKFDREEIEERQIEVTVNDTSFMNSTLRTNESNLRQSQNCNGNINKNTSVSTNSGPTVPLEMQGCKSQPYEQTECTDLSTVLPAEPYCFIGLHTCGDLSISVIQHFFSLPLARQLIYIPCCYHKLKCLDSDTSLSNFPLSQALRKVYKERKFLRVPFLRMAAQETAGAWHRYNPREKKEKVFQLLFRGVLQLYAARENVKLIKKARRPFKVNLSTQDISSIISASTESFHLKCLLTSSLVEWNKPLLSQLWSDHVAKTSLVRTLLALQYSLQCTAESLILLDRLRFMHESGRVRIELLRIFDELISPRRYCFVVVSSGTEKGAGNLTWPQDYY